MHDNKKTLAYWIPLGLIVVISVATGILDYFTPLMGDDMGKWIAMGADNEESFPGRQAISFLGAQYFGCNGRVFDAFGPLIVNLLPRVLASAVIGFMTGLFFYAMCLAADVFKPGKTTFACGFVAISMFALPWWDSMFMRVCHFNYIWASAFAILFIHEWFKERHPDRASLFMLFLLGCLSGCFHEQIGVAMTAYFGLYVILKRCRDWHWVPFLGLCFGTLITIASPAIWNRNSGFITDSSRIEMLWTTLPLVVVLAVITGIIYLSGSKHKPIVKSEPFKAYFYIAVFSSVIALYSSIPGRTGWLAESCSLIALSMLCLGVRYKLNRRVSHALIILCYLCLLVHFSVSIYWQRKMFMEYDKAIDLYEGSDSGIVKMDYTNRLEVSPLTLYRVKGLPDGDDTYLQSVFKNHYGPGKQFILIGSQSVISDSLPDGYALMCNTNADTIMIHTDSNGLRHTVTPFMENGITRYQIEPLAIDPGDKWHPVNSF